MKNFLMAGCWCLLPCPPYSSCRSSTNTSSSSSLLLANTPPRTTRSTQPAAIQFFLRERLLLSLVLARKIIHHLASRRILLECTGHVDSHDITMHTSSTWYVSKRQPRTMHASLKIFDDGRICSASYLVRTWYKKRTPCRARKDENTGPTSHCMH